MMAAVPTLLVSLVARSNAQGEGIIGGASAHDPATSILLATGDCDGEVSYNGICTPASFPPRQNYSRAVPHPPYLDNPPALINITVGRQLFVDSFLIANTSGTQQQFHAAKYHEENPVLKPDQPWEGTFAMPFSGGAWWEDKEDRLALWYRCGGGYASQQSEGESSSTGRSGPTTTGTCVAYSSDGVHFSKPLQDVVPNTNFVRQVAFDGNTVWLDRGERNASRRYKMADVDAAQSYAHYTLLASPDGVHWETVVNRTEGTISDCSRVFYNPFREKWVFSIKTNIDFGVGRARGYWESPSLFTDTSWTQNSPRGPWDAPNDVYPWTWADVDDDSDPETVKPRTVYSQLYTVDAVAYESVMIGFFSILECDWYKADPKTNKCPPPQYHERNEVFAAFSRDGFHWSRPPAPRIPLAHLNESQRTNWNWEDVQSTGGGFITMPDELYMYVSGRYVPANASGPGAPQFDSTGLATLRRDGFASLTVAADTAEAGSVTTRPVVWSAGKFLFVNFNGKNLRASVLNASTGLEIQPFSMENSVALTNDTTRAQMHWKLESDDGLAALVGQAVRFHFTYGGRSNAAREASAGPSSLYSFWVSESECGQSSGYTAGGGPGIGGDVDTRGSCV